MCMKITWGENGDSLSLLSEGMKREIIMREFLLETAKTPPVSWLTHISHVPPLKDIYCRMLEYCTQVTLYTLSLYEQYIFLLCPFNQSIPSNERLS